MLTGWRGAQIPVGILSERNSRHVLCSIFPVKELAINHCYKLKTKNESAFLHLGHTNIGGLHCCLLQFLLLKVRSSTQDVKRRGGWLK